MKKYALILLSLSVGSTSMADTPKVDRYNGRSPYRLIFRPPAERSFDPNEDIIKGSARTKAAEDMDLLVQQAVVRAASPLTALIGGLKDSSEMPNAISMVTAYQAVLRDSVNSNIQSRLKEIKKNAPDLFPREYSVYMLPWQPDSKDYYYRSDKISASDDPASGLVLTPNSKSDKFRQDVSVELGRLQMERYKNTRGQFYLLGIVAQLVIEDPDKADSSSRLSTQAMFGLREVEIPQVVMDPQVKIEKVVIPKYDLRGLATVLTLRSRLGEKSRARLELEFGQFTKFDGTTFFLVPNEVKDRKTYKYTPVLVGTPQNVPVMGPKTIGPITSKGIDLNVSGAPLKVEFQIHKIQFDLIKLEAYNVDTISHVGLTKLIPPEMTYNKGNMKEVDDAIQGKLNEISEKAQKDAITGAVKSIFGGLKK